MKIQWTGTAGFKIQSGNACFLIDPYLSRNKDASPAQPLTPKDLGEFSHIFISHGHFDHILDIPDVVRDTRARVICDSVAARTLTQMGVPRDHIEEVTHPGFKIDFNHVHAEAFYSRHIRFDAKLLLTTLMRAGRQIREILPLFRDYPCGQVLSWRLELEDRRIHFFGSGGSTRPELQALASMPIDLLLLPLQGHSKICDKAVTYVEMLQPAVVIAHHQDNFYPPVSQTVDIKPFLEQVHRRYPKTKTVVMNINETIEF